MKKVTTRYLIGYLIRGILGTAIVMCAISAVRILWILPEREAEVAPPLDRALILPDRLVHLSIQKYKQWQTSKKMAADAPETIAVAETPHQPETAPEQPTPPATQAPRTAPATATVPAMPAMPDMPEMPTAEPKTKPAVMAAMPDMPVLPGAPTTSPLTSAPSGASAVSTARWGLTVSPSASVYSTTGKNLGSVAAGTPLKVIDTRSTKEGDLIICSIVLDGRMLSKAIVREDDTRTYDGNLAETSEAERNLRTRHAQLLAAVSARETELRRAAAGNNPHRDEYKTAYASYKTFAKLNNALLKEHQNATGARRNELANKLRELKLKSGDITKSYQAAKQKYTAWKQQHPLTEPDLNGDQTLKQLRQKLAQLETELASL